MLNKLWAGMILVGICFGAVTGHMADVSQAAFDSAKDAIGLCITMLGIVGCWCGMMKIGEAAGQIELLTRKMSPFVQFLFPRIPKGHRSLEYISTNIVANA